MRDDARRVALPSAEADGGTSWVVTLSQRVRLAHRPVPSAGPGRGLRGRPERPVSGVLAPTAEVGPGRRRLAGHRPLVLQLRLSGTRPGRSSAFPVTDEAGEVKDQGVALIPTSEIDASRTPGSSPGMKSLRQQLPGRAGRVRARAPDVSVPRRDRGPLRHRIRRSTRPSTARRWCRSSRSSWSARNWAWAGGSGTGLSPEGGQKPISYTFFEAQADSSPSSCRSPRPRC